MDEEDLNIAVVGACSAGKSTLIAGLEKRGYQARHIAQEHSMVPDMWERRDAPDVLVYLDVSYEVSMQRKPLNMSKEEFAELDHRLRHAREHADLYIQTDDLSPGEVLKKTEDFLRSLER